MLGTPVFRGRVARSVTDCRLSLCVNPFVTRLVMRRHWVVGAIGTGG